MTRCILHFPKKGNLGLAKNSRGTTLTSIAAKIYNTQLHNHIESKIDTILRKNKMASGEIDPWHHKFWLSVEFLKVYMQKTTINNIIWRLYQSLWLYSQRKDGANLLAYGLLKESVVAIMILYWNTTVTFHYPDGDTDYFDIVAGVRQGDTLAPYIFIICLNYALRTSIDKIKENTFKLTKERSRRYDANYADDIAFLETHPPKPKSCYIVWNELLQALASMSLPPPQKKRNVCALIKQATSPH